MPTPSGGDSWGILGGSFDPVHIGHISLARDIINIKKLDGILFIPSYTHPFKKKQTITTFDNRIEMLRLATDNEPNFIISTIERDEDLSGFTIDTIKALKKAYPDTEFYFIIGADNLDQLDSWHQPDEILKEVTLLSGNRPKFENSISKNKWLDKIQFIESSEIDISSSELRKILSDNYNDGRLKLYLKPEILDFIKSKELYR